MGLTSTPEPVNAAANPSPFNVSPLPTPPLPTPHSNASPSSSSFSSSSSTTTTTTTNSTITSSSFSSSNTRSAMTQLRRWTSSLNSSSKNKEGGGAGKRKAGSKAGGKGLTIAMIGPPQPLTTPVPFVCSPLPYDDEDDDLLAGEQSSDPSSNLPFRPSSTYVTISSAHSPPKATSSSPITQLAASQSAPGSAESTQSMAAVLKGRSKWRVRLFLDQKDRERQKTSITSTSTGPDDEEEEEWSPRPSLLVPQKSSSTAMSAKSVSDSVPPSGPTTSSSLQASDQVDPSLAITLTPLVSSHINGPMSTTATAIATAATRLSSNQDSSCNTNFTDVARGLQQNSTVFLANSDALSPVSIPSLQFRFSLDDSSMVVIPQPSLPLSKGDTSLRPTLPETTSSQPTHPPLHNEHIKPDDMSPSPSFLTPTPPMSIHGAKTNTSAPSRPSVHTLLTERPSLSHRPRPCSISSDSDTSSSDSEDSATDDPGAKDTVSSHPLPTSPVQSSLPSLATLSTSTTTINSTRTATPSSPPPLSSSSSSGGRSLSLSSTLLKAGGIRIPTSLMTLFSKDKESPILFTSPRDVSNEANSNRDIIHSSSNSSSGSLSGPNSPSLSQSDPRATNLKRLAYIHTLRKLRERGRRPFRHAVLLHLLLLQLRRGISKLHCEEIGKYYGNMTPAQLAQKLELGNSMGLAPSHQYQQYQTYIARLRMQGEHGYGPHYAQQQQQMSERYTGLYGQHANKQSHFQPLPIPVRSLFMPLDGGPVGPQLNGVSAGATKASLETDIETSTPSRAPFAYPHSSSVQSQRSAFRKKVNFGRKSTAFISDLQIPRSGSATSPPSLPQIRSTSPPSSVIQPPKPLSLSNIPTPRMPSIQVYPSLLAATNKAVPSYPHPAGQVFAMEPLSVDPIYELAPSKTNILPKRTTGRKGLIFQQQQQYQSMISSMGIREGEFFPLDSALTSGARPSFASSTVTTVRTDDDDTITCPLRMDEDKTGKLAILPKNTHTHRDRQTSNGGAVVNGYRGGGYPETPMHSLLNRPLPCPHSPTIVESPSYQFFSQHFTHSSMVSHTTAPSFPSTMAPINKFATMGAPTVGSHPPSARLEYLATSGPSSTMTQHQQQKSHSKHHHSSQLVSMQLSSSPSMMILPHHRYSQFHQRRPSAPDVLSSQHHHQYLQLHQRRPSASDLPFRPSVSPFYPPSSAFTIASASQRRRPSLLPLPFRTAAEGQRLFEVPAPIMQRHNYRFPPSPSSMPSTTSMMTPATISVSDPAIGHMTPATSPGIIGPSTPTSSTTTTTPLYHHHAPTSTKSSPSTNAPESPGSLTPPSSATSDATSISEDSVNEDDGDQSQQWNKEGESHSLMTTVAVEEKHKQATDQVLEHCIESPAVARSSFGFSMQKNGSDSTAEWATPASNGSSEQASKSSDLTMLNTFDADNMLLLPSMTSSSSSNLPLPSPPLSPLTEFEFSLMPTAVISATGPEVDVTRSSMPSTPEPSPPAINSSAASFCFFDGAPLASTPSAPIVALARSANGFANTTTPTKLVFDTLQSSPVTATQASSVSTTSSLSASTLDKSPAIHPKRANRPTIENLIRNLNKTVNSQKNESTTAISTTAASTTAKTNSSPGSIPGHAKRPSMNTPSIIIRPSTGAGSQGSGSTIKRAVISSASMLPSPAPDSPLPGQENSHVAIGSEQQHRKHLPESMLPSPPAVEDHVGAGREEEEDMPLAWVQMRLRN